MERHNYVLFQMNKDTIVKPFSCTDKDLTEFLLEDACNYQEELMAVTYILEATDCDSTIAYFSLLNDSLKYNPNDNSIWNKINRLINNKKRRKSYPSVKIGRLAVNERHTGLSIGSKVIDLIIRMFISGNKTGCRFLTVDAYANATGFYQKCGFKFFTPNDANDSTRFMYLDLKPIKDQMRRGDAV